MKTVGYVRVSTDKQAERGISLEVQAEKIRAMALVQGAELSEIIVESGESAKSLNRPGMARLLAMGGREQGKGRHRGQAGPPHPQREGSVRIAGAFREARRGVGIGGGVARHRLRCRKAGAEHPGGSFTMGAGGHRRAHRDAMRHKRNQGERVGNIAFGSRLADDGQHLEPDPAEQAALAEIWRLRGQRTTLRGIAAALNQRDFRTRRGTPWRLESVARVLKKGRVLS